jgi:hypothetical protein
VDWVRYLHICRSVTVTECFIRCRIRLQYSRTPLHRDLQRFYSATFLELSSGCHEATPFVKFICQIVNTGPIGARVVVDSGILGAVRTVLINASSPASSNTSSELVLDCDHILENSVTDSEPVETSNSDAIMADLDKGLKMRVRGVITI